MVECQRITSSSVSRVTWYAGVLCHHTLFNTTQPIIPQTSGPIKTTQYRVIPSLRYFYSNSVQCMFSAVPHSLPPDWSKDHILKCTLLPRFVRPTAHTLLFDKIKIEKKTLDILSLIMT